MEQREKLSDKELKNVAGGAKGNCPHSNLIRVSSNPPTYKCQACGQLIRPE